MTPGEMRTIIAIQQATSTPDAYGSSTQQWADFVRCWSKMWTSKATEHVVGSRIVSDNKVVFRIRYRAGITESMRVVKVFDSTEYDIVGIRNIEERNRELEITCRKNA